MVYKLYVSAILDLCDWRIASFGIQDTNNITLVHGTLDQALNASSLGIYPLAP